MGLAVVALLAGLGLMVAAVMVHRRAEDQAIDQLLGMSPLLPEEEQDEMRAITVRAVDLAGQVVDRMDRGNKLGQILERAQIPLRPGEFLIVLGAGTLGIAALLLVVTGTLLVAVAGALGAVVIAQALVKRRVSKRRKAFEAQLPDALGLAASSLSAGHTFLRAIQMMCEESGPPISEEFSRVVVETRLGDSLVDSLDRMAARLQIRDVDMVVQAIRIQQTVGGKLADLLHTLAEFIRVREEVRREVQVLTAEGRMSAYVLAGLVPFLFMVIRVLNPEYIKPLYSGGGLLLLIGCGVSVLAGMFVILRMVKIDI